MTLKHNGVATTQAVEHVELPIGNTNNPLRKEFPFILIKKLPHQNCI